MLTATVQKPQKSLKRWYYSASRWHSGDVTVGNISFLMIFAVFDPSPLTLWINCSFSINLQLRSVHSAITAMNYTSYLVSSIQLLSVTVMWTEDATGNKSIWPKSNFCPTLYTSWTNLFANISILNDRQLIIIRNLRL